MPIFIDYDYCFFKLSYCNLFLYIFIFNSLRCDPDRVIPAPVIPRERTLIHLRRWNIKLTYLHLYPVYNNEMYLLTKVKTDDE